MATLTLSMSLTHGNSQPSSLPTGQEIWTFGDSAGLLHPPLTNRDLQDSSSGTLDAPPSYELSFDEAYDRWKAAYEAAKQLAAHEKALDGCQKELMAAKVQLAALSKTSAEFFQKLHTKAKIRPLAKIFRSSHLRGPRHGRQQVYSSLPPGTMTSLNSAMPLSRSTSGLRDDGSVLSFAQYAELETYGSRVAFMARPDDDAEERRETAKREFEKAHREEMRQTEVVEQLEEMVRQAEKKRDDLLPIVKVKELAWTQLEHVARRFTSMSEILTARTGDAVEAIAAADAALGLAKRAAQDMQRVCKTAQHAHKYLTDVLQLTDAICGPGRRKYGIAAGLFGSMGTITDYQEAVRIATRAQVCLNECLRVLEPHAYLLPDERRADTDALKTLGVLQMTKVYNLLFGGRLMDTGIGRSMQLMLERQETAYAHLTRLAVWVQDYVPVALEIETRALLQRDDARQQLAELWCTRAQAQA